MASNNGHQHICEADIFAEEFPDDISLSALCDCGRHKRMNTLATYKPGPRAPMGETDYQSTFKAKVSPRPRSSKRPPPTPLNTNPAPMTFDTNQRTEFKNLGHVERVKPIVHEELYEPPQVPMETKTYYTQEYIPKQLKAAASGGTPPGPGSYMKDTLRAPPSLPMEGRTTNKEAFKPWMQQPALAFGELPSFTGSILFPERKPLPESTMRHSFQGKFIPPVPPIKMASPSIRLEGNHNFDTTHNDTYKGAKGEHRALPMVQKASASGPAGQRGKFNGETQSKRDFPGYRGQQPLPPKPAEPAPTTIDLKFNNKRSFSTENRSIFRGHNVVNHPAPRSCKAAEDEFAPPSVKFETETSQKRDYKPIDFSTVSSAPKATMPQSAMMPADQATFDGITMNSEFFKNWGVPQRVRFGDFHENRPYVPPQHPFKGESITQSSFVAKKAEPATMFRPTERPNSKVGAKVDYSTCYSDEYQKKQVRMCRAQVYLLQQEMKRRQRDKKGVNSAPPAKSIAVK